MSEDEIMEIKYISGIQPFMDEDGETVLAVSWVECPMMKTKRITMRSAASRETAERFCRDFSCAEVYPGSRSAKEQCRWLSRFGANTIPQAQVRSHFAN